MPSLQTSKWERNSFPNLKPTVPVSSSEQKTEEEYEKLKLADKINKMFVGMTRAKRVLRLSYVNLDGAIHSTYLNNIDDNLLEKNYCNIESQDDYVLKFKKLIDGRDYDYKRDFR